MKRYKLLGVNIDSISLNEVYKKISGLTGLARPAHVILLDTYLLMRAQFDKELFQLINSADLVLPVSFGLKFGLDFLKIKTERVYNYFNFLINLLLHFTEDGKFIYILGGKKEVIKKADKNIKDSFPGIRLVGRFHSQYKKEFEDDLITAIRKACPALVLVGTRSPEQEKWIYKKRSDFDTGVFIGVGDFINIIGGKGNSPSERSIQSGLYGIKKLFKSPFRVSYYFLYFIFLLYSKIFKKQ